MCKFYRFKDSTEIYEGGAERIAHVFVSHLFLRELDLYKWLHCSEEFPPWPVLYAMVLFNVLLNASDCQILNLHTHMQKGKNINVENAKVSLLQYNNRKTVIFIYP